MSIKLDGVSYAYNVGTPAENVALDGVSLVVERGEWLSIVGHTGSGKSTLAQHLNLLLSPQSGTVSVDGELVQIGTKAARGLRRKVGLVFQYPESQFFAETVRDEIEFAPSNWGVKGDDLKSCVDEAVSASGLDPALLAANPFALSGGQRRRAAIASVLAMRPEYLVLDEPTAGLDAAGIRDLTGMLSDLRERGMAVVQVTHDLGVALERSDRVLALERGRAVAEGTPEEIASYLAENPVKGLLLPPCASFAHRLRSRGINVPLTSGAAAIAEAVEKARAVMR
ncbi:MAG: ATP-binding cassette domain-containing protein [Synergistaceae bacterium]|nr:ATP-binding cassette domain-containing protein [Synergistaceae bacterium]